MKEKPAKFKPAFLQAMAVIIICEPSSEWMKFGGNAVLCLLTITYKRIIKISFSFRVQVNDILRKIGLKKPRLER